MNNYSSTRSTSTTSHPPPSSMNAILATKEQLQLIDHDQYLDSFPKGYRFNPTDGEIILHYLNPRVEKKTLPPNRINEVNLYDHHPEYLTSGRFKAYEDKEWYFFTPRDRKYRNGGRPKRAAGDGFWKATGVDKEILWDNDKKQKLGAKKTLVFYQGKPPKGNKTCWVMHEFKVAKSTIEKNSRADMRLDDCVLCRIHIKKDKPISTAGSRKRRVHHSSSSSVLVLQEEININNAVNKSSSNPQVPNDESNGVQDQEEEEEEEEEEEYDEEYDEDIEDLCSNYDSTMHQYYPTHDSLWDQTLLLPPSWSTVPPPVLLNNNYIMYGAANSTTAATADNTVSITGRHNTHNNIQQQAVNYQIHQQRERGYSDMMMMNSLSSSVLQLQVDHPPPPTPTPQQGYYPPPPPTPQQGYYPPDPSPPTPQQATTPQQGYYPPPPPPDHPPTPQQGYYPPPPHDHATLGDRHMVFKESDNSSTDPDFYAGVNPENFETPLSAMMSNYIGANYVLPDYFPDCGWL